MTASKIIRIILAAVCVIAILLGLLLPLISYFGVGINLIDCLQMGDESAYFIIIIAGLACMLIAAVFALIFPVHRAVPAIIGIIAGAAALVGWILFLVDAGNNGASSLLGAGVYLGLVLAVAVIALSIILLVIKDKKAAAAPAPARAPMAGYNMPPQQRPMPKAHIVGLAGVYQNASFDVSDGRPVMFGRDTNTCSVIFDQFETAVSRQHCIVTFLPNANMYSVRDMSKNGTFIGSMNNRMPNNIEQNVQRGTIIYLGSSKNSFKLD